MPKEFKFQYGNYNRYYGYRNQDDAKDPRLECFRSEWFEGQDVLDIGCNIGNVTLSIARDFKPEMIVGIDIDDNLVRIAKRSTKRYIDPARNVKFIVQNYVLECDDLLDNVKPEFDCILCLSVTKWIHLNWGDDGLKRVFKRMFKQLKPGGRLILEPQPWSSYRKKKSVSKCAAHNYSSIKLFPEKFIEYLLSDEVGFSSVETLDIPEHNSKGFQRPIFMLRKSMSQESSFRLPMTNSVSESQNPEETDEAEERDKEEEGKGLIDSQSSSSIEVGESESIQTVTTNSRL